MTNKQLTKIFGKAMIYELILLIIFSICATWSKYTLLNDFFGIWGKLISTDIILLLSSLIFFVIYDTSKDN